MTWSIESVRHADLPAAAIFRFYTDPSTWPSWGHNTRGARAEGALVEGATVYVRAGYGRVWPVLVKRLEPDRLIETEVRPPGLVVLQRFDLTPTDGGVTIRHEIEVSGWAAGFTGVTLKPLYRRLLAKETRKLVELAERSHHGTTM